jgi:hypothetical protein
MGPTFQLAKDKLWLVSPNEQTRRSGGSKLMYSCRDYLMRAANLKGAGALGRK